MADLSSLLGFKDKRYVQGVVLYALGDDDRPESAFEFQYFPETITDSKSINYSTKDIPGASLPIRQWVSSGDRTISFSAVLATDINIEMDSELNFGNTTERLVDYAESRIVNPTRLDLRGRRQNVDVAAGVAYLRSFMFPTYGAASTLGKPITVAPPKCLLQIRNSKLNLAGDPSQMADAPILCVMTSCEVTWEAFFSNNLPRVATVSLSFAQIAQFDRNVSFPGRPVGVGYDSNWTNYDFYRNLKAGV